MIKTDPVIDFLLDCIIDLTKYDADINFVKKKSVFIVDENVSTRGFFFENVHKKPSITCAIGHQLDDWLPIFIHEYSHFVQWKKNLNVWTKCNYIDADTTFKIFHNKYVEESKMNEVISDLRNLEIDCEKRTVDLIKRYKLPIDTALYTKRANAYLFFYTHILKCRSWYPMRNPPYRNAELIGTMSSRFYGSYDKIPKKLQCLYDKHYPPVSNNRLYI